MFFLMDREASMGSLPQGPRLGQRGLENGVPFLSSLRVKRHWSLALTVYVLGVG